MKLLKSVIIIIVLLLISMYVKAQNNFYILQGKVINEQTGLFVNKTLISIPQINKEIETDKYGSFLLALPPAYYFLYIINDEYTNKIIELNLKQDTSLSIQIIPAIKTYLIEDVIVSTNRINKTSEIQVGLERLESKTISNIPTIGGEKDVVKAMQFLPGIKAGAEGNSELIVRGGSSDQNLFLLDNAQLYNSVHLLGFVSAYNPLSIGKADIYKAGFPAKYGGKLSSVIDVTSKAPTYNTFFGELCVGIISAKAGFNIPVIKDKSVLHISGRRTYFDLFKDPLNQKSYKESLNFHDFFLKYSHKIGSTQLSLSYYAGRDKNYTLFKPQENKDQQDEFNFIKSNQILNLLAESNTNAGLNSLQLSFIGSKTEITDSKHRAEETESYFSLFRSGITDFCIKDNLQTNLTDKLVLNAGIEGAFHLYTPANLNRSDITIDTTINSIPETKSVDLHVYAEINYTLSDKNTIQTGLRIGNYRFEGKLFPTIEPRVLHKYQINKNLSLKSSYTIMSQPIHLLSNPGLGYPLDIWIPSTKKFEPEISHQVSTGLFLSKPILNQHFAFSSELYYKSFRNIITYNDGYSSHNLTSLNNPSKAGMNGMITMGTGNSYGLELMAEKTSGAFTGWVGYTLSWTKHTFPEINKGNSFYPRYDSRHTISVVGMYRINKKWSAGLSWNYNTGQAITMPVSSYNTVDYDYLNDAPKETPEYFMFEQSTRNDYRMKDFHCLTLEFKRYIKLKRSTGILDFGIYNVYNRRNPYYYYIDQQYLGTNTEGDRLSRRVIKSVSVFPLMPQASFTWRF